MYPSDLSHLIEEFSKAIRCCFVGKIANPNTILASWCRIPRLAVLLFLRGHRQVYIGIDLLQRSFALFPESCMGFGGSFFDWLEVLVGSGGSICLGLRINLFISFFKFPFPNSCESMIRIIVMEYRPPSDRHVRLAHSTA
jgi:hypothetical protein